MPGPPPPAATLKVGLIGCGRIARLFHLPVLSAARGARLVAVAEMDPEARAAAARAARGARVWASDRELLNDAEVDAVVIATPPITHADIATRAFESGRHVYVEKPSAVTAAAAHALADLAERGGDTNGPRTARCGLNFRHHPAVADARRRLAEGGLGRVQAVRSVFTAAARSLPGWKQQTATGGGVLLDLGVHHLDLVTHLLALPIDAVACTVEDRDAGQEVTATLCARLCPRADAADDADGGGPPRPPGVVFSGTYAAMTGRGENRLEIYGERGNLVIDTHDAAPRAPVTSPGRFARLAEAWRAARPGTLIASPWGEPSFARSLQAFIDAANGGSDPHGADLRAAAHAVDAVAAARDAAASGRWHRVRPLGDASSGSAALRLPDVEAPPPAVQHSDVLR